MQGWLANPMRGLPLHLRGTKAFRVGPSSFWTRSKADACCPNRKRTYTHGWTVLLRLDSAQAFIVPAFRRRMMGMLLQPKISAIARAHGRLRIGRLMMHVLPRPDVRFHNSPRARRKAA